MSEPKAAKMGYEDQPAEQQTRVGELLWEAHSAASKIVEFTTGKSATEFARSEILQAVVAKMLEILAAALTELQQVAPEEASRISYLGASLEVQAHVAELDGMWRFVQECLPALLADVSAQLEDWHQS